MTHMTIEQMRAAIADDDAAQVPPGFERSVFPDSKSFVNKLGWVLSRQDNNAWRAARFERCDWSKPRSWHASGEGSTPEQAIAACRSELRRIVAEAHAAADDKTSDPA